MINKTHWSYSWFKYGLGVFVGILLPLVQSCQTTNFYTEPRFGYLPENNATVLTRTFYVDGQYSKPHTDETIKILKACPFRVVHTDQIQDRVYTNMIDLDSDVFPDSLAINKLNEVIGIDYLLVGMHANVGNGAGLSTSIYFDQYDELWRDKNRRSSTYNYWLINTKTHEIVLHQKAVAQGGTVSYGDNTTYNVNLPTHGTRQKSTNKLKGVFRCK